MNCVPRYFLCKFPLCLGAFVVGVVMICILIIFAIGTLVQILYVKDCEKCDLFTWRNCYGYSVTGFIYVVILITANLWFFWGIKKRKASVVLSWIVVSSTWLALVFCLLIVLISLHYSQSSNAIAALFALIFGLIAMAILLYGLMVIIGFWRELKQSKLEPAVPLA